MDIKNNIQKDKILDSYLVKPRPSVKQLLTVEVLLRFHGAVNIMVI